MDDFEKLYRDYFETINLFLVSLCNNPDLALELTQETFFKALRSVNKFRGECDIKVWLCQIAKTHTTHTAKSEKNSSRQMMKLQANSETMFHLSTPLMTLKPVTDYTKLYTALTNHTKRFFRCVFSENFLLQKSASYSEKPTIGRA